MRKSVKLGLVVILAGGVALAGLAALAWRLFGLDMVEALIVESLADQGVPVTALTLRSAGLDGAVLTDLRIDMAGSVTIDRIEAGYRPAALILDRHLDRLVVSGIRAGLAAPASGSAAPVERAPPRWPSAGLPVDDIVVRDGVITLATPAGDLGLAVDLEARSAADGGLAVSGRTRISGAAGEMGLPFTGGLAPNGAFELTAMLDSGSLGLGGAVLERPEGTVAIAGTLAGATVIETALAADIALPDGSATRLEMSGHLTGTGGTLDLEFGSAGAGRAGLTGKFTAWDGPSPSFDLALDAEMPFLESLAALSGAVETDWPSQGLLNAGLSGTWDRLADPETPVIDARLFVEADLSSPQTGQRLTIDVAAGLESDFRTVRLMSENPSRFSWQSNDTSAAFDLTLDDDFEMTFGLAGNGWTLVADGPARLADRAGELSGWVNLTASGDGAESGQAGRISAEITASGSAFGMASIAGGRAELAGRFSIGGDRWRFETETCQPLAADRLEFGVGLALPDGVSACWSVGPETPGSDSAVPPQRGGDVVMVRTDPMLMLLDTGAGESLRIELDEVAAEIATGSPADGGLSADITTTGAVVRLPDLPIAVEGAALTLRSASGAEPALRFRLENATIRSLGSPAGIVPLHLAGRAALGQDDLLTFDATIRGAGGALAATVDGRHDLASGAGSAGIRLDPVSFAPGVRQPAEIAPALAALAAEVTGSISADARIDWRDRISSSGQVRIEDLTLAKEGVAVRGVEGTLFADSLFPLNLPDGQLLAIGGADLGLTLEEGAIAFGLRGDRLSVQGIGFSLAGGSLAVGPFQVRPGDPELRLVVTMQGVELGPLSAQFPIEGLTVTGRLDGDIPIRLFDDTISIDNGVLETTEPGVIRYIASLPFGSPDEGGVGLLIGAVRNFQYEGLRATLNGRTGDDLEVAIRLTGANPDLYDGYPIALNINLSGDLEEVVRNGLNSMAIADDAGSLLRGE